MLDLAGSYSVVDSHTAGHPTRVILSGIPALPGKTVRERRDHFRKHFDHLRPMLLHEPRGHAAMVGLVPQPSDVADYGAFFISSYVYLDMCGHATIGFAKTLAATGQVPSESSSFTLETPAGLVSVGLERGNQGEIASVYFRNVPSRLAREDVSANVPGIGRVSADIAYGGCWYAIVEAESVGLRLEPDRVSQALVAGGAIKHALMPVLATSSPDIELDSVLFVSPTGPLSGTHLVVLESNKFDRSPCGTGTSARIAQLYRKGRMRPGQTYEASNIFGVAFSARIAQESGSDIVPEVSGNAHLTAFSTLLRERSDPLDRGFLCR